MLQERNNFIISQGILRGHRVILFLRNHDFVSVHLLPGSVDWEGGPHVKPFRKCRLKEKCNKGTERKRCEGTKSDGKKFSWQTTFRNGTLSLVNGFHTTAEAREQEEEERDVSGRHER